MKLYRLPHSCYARKIEVLLDLLGRKHEKIDVPYADRHELVELTGGYLYVPVLQTDDGKVVLDSRRIAEHLLAGPGGGDLVPPPWDGPIWAYHDWCDGPLEDVLFRISSPITRDRMPTPYERALFTLIKERKFGPGCIDAWARQRDELIARARVLLAPTARTVAAQPFLFGPRPTLADAALHGMLAMLRYVDDGFPALLGPDVAAWMGRVDEEAAARRAR